MTMCVDTTIITEVRNGMAAASSPLIPTARPVATANAAIHADRSATPWTTRRARLKRLYIEIHRGSSPRLRVQASLPNIVDPRFRVSTAYTAHTYRLSGRRL